MRYRKIPDETIRRLPIYLRAIKFLAEKGKLNISSGELADILGINSAQIRKDFSYFGGFGTRGVGYNISTLIEQINKILRLDTRHSAALVGVGNLGSVILTYGGFNFYGFNIVAAFDKDPGKIGKKVGGIQVEAIDAIGSIRDRAISLAIIAVPRSSAQDVAQMLIEAGVKGILNFSPCHIDAPKKVKIITIDIAMGLARLPYYTSSR